MKKMPRGFVMILVISFIAIIMLVAWVIINIGCSEILETRARNDLMAANQVANAGAEIMYAKLQSLTNTTVNWPVTIPVSDSTVVTAPSGGTAIGTFTATADTSASAVFGIVSRGTVNGRTANVSVTYGFASPFTNGPPLGSMGDIELSGSQWWIFKSRVTAAGPLESAADISWNSLTTINGPVLENQPFVAPSFWSGATFDANGDTAYLTPSSGSEVTLADVGADPAKLVIFNADNTYNGDGANVINEKDAFYTYYTSTLNNQLNLQIGPGQTNYYNGDQTFGPGDVPVGTKVVFVNGNVTILFNDQNWATGPCDHTIVAMGDITVVQPVNGIDDRLTIVSAGDVNTGGINIFGNVKGELDIFASENLNAFYGGTTYGSWFAMDGLTVDTVLAIPGFLNRNINRGTTDWADPTKVPVGLPPGYPTVSLTFMIKNEAIQYKPVWQRN